MRTATMTAEQVIDRVQAMRPDSNPVAAEHDSMAAYCEGEPWYVWFGDEDTTPERLVFDLD